MQTSNEIYEYLLGRLGTSPLLLTHLRNVFSADEWSSLLKSLQGTPLATLAGQVSPAVIAEKKLPPGGRKARMIDVSNIKNMLGLDVFSKTNPPSGLPFG